MTLITIVRLACRRPLTMGLLCLPLAAACGGADEPTPAGSATPVYNSDTGRLEQLQSDRDGDGTIDTVAFMDGTRVVRIEIDRDNDGAVDRREFYAASGEDPAGIIERAEEIGGPDALVTRREFYVDGVLARVEEDASLDGQVDKWETYRDGRLVEVALDLIGRGSPSRRLVYAEDGSVERVEADPDGDGQFEPVDQGGAGQ